MLFLTFFVICYKARESTKKIVVVVVNPNPGSFVLLLTKSLYYRACIINLWSCMLPVQCLGELGTFSVQYTHQH